MDTVETRSRSGWVTFSAVLIIIVGGYNLIWGYAALDKKELFDEAALIYSNLNFWGWAFIVIGALQILTAILLFMRRLWGAILAALGASFSAVMAFFALLANTDWAFLIIALDVLIVWSVVAHQDDFASS
jgi:hypothetical protein